MQRHKITEIVNGSRNTALEQSVKFYLGGLNRVYVATSIGLSSAVVYTRHLLSPREGVSNSLVQHLREHKNQRIQR